MQIHKKSRFLLKSKHFNENILKSVKFDLKNKIIKISIYDIYLDNYNKANDYIKDLAEGRINETYTLCFLNGMAETLSEIKFYGIKLKKHNCVLSYDKSGITTHKIEVSFLRCE